MRVIRHRSLRMPSVSGPWRSILSVGLLIAYLILIGDAIHCQYASVSHEHHGVPQSPQNKDATHCLVANHGAATLPAIAAVRIHALHVLQHLHDDTLILLAAKPLASTASRAPPRL